jgi:hypothetical protein
MDKYYYIKDGSKIALDAVYMKKVEMNGKTALYVHVVNGIPCTFEPDEIEHVVE